MGLWRLLGWGGAMGTSKPLTVCTRHQAGLVYISPWTLPRPSILLSHHGATSEGIQHLLFFSSRLFLGDPGGSDHPGQPPAGGFWKRQDSEEWQLLKICKFQSNCQLSPKTKSSPLILDMKNCHINYNIFGLILSKWFSSFYPNWDSLIHFEDRVGLFLAEEGFSCPSLTGQHHLRASGSHSDSNSTSREQFLYAKISLPRWKHFNMQKSIEQYPLTS